MAAPIDLQALIRIVIISGHAVLVCRLFKNSLRTIYRYFWLYLIFCMVRGLALLPVRRGTDAYAWVWLSTEPLVWIFYVLVVLELYSLALKDFKGMATLGRWVVLAALFASVFISALTLLPDLSNPSERYPILLYFLVIQRGLNFSLAIFLLLITAFLVWYPVPVNRNVIVHSIAFSAYFLSETMAVFIRNVAGHQVVSVVNPILQVTTLVTLLAWILFLNPAGETKRVVLRYRSTPEDEERILEQLSTINNALLRVARK